MRDYAELARLGWVTRSRMTQIMKLRDLAGVRCHSALRRDSPERTTAPGPENDYALPVPGAGPDGAWYLT